MNTPPFPSPPFEPQPRWPNGPPMCETANLPAFKTIDEAKAFHEANGPGSRIIRSWRCDVCNCYHYLSKPRPPSGDSSGISRR